MQLPFLPAYSQAEELRGPRTDAGAGLCRLAANSTPNKTLTIPKPKGKYFRVRTARAAFRALSTEAITPQKTGEVALGSIGASVLERYRCRPSCLDPTLVTVVGHRTFLIRESARLRVIIFLPTLRGKFSNRTTLSGRASP